MCIRDRVSLLTEYMKPPSTNASHIFYRGMVGGMGGTLDLRVEIIRTLGAIGPDAAAALPLLEKIASMKPAETGRTDFDDLANNAIAKIKGTGQDEEKSGEAPRKPAPSASGRTAPPSPFAPTYDGKTLDEWLAELKTELNPERKAEAMAAIAGFADEASAKKGALAILSLMRIQAPPGVPERNTPRGPLVDPAQQALCQMPADAVIAAMLEEVAGGNDNSRRFVRWLFMILTAETSPGMHQTRGIRALAHAVKSRAVEIASKALDLSRHDSVSRREAALAIAWHLARVSGDGPAKIDGFIERFQEELSYRDAATIPLAVHTLIEHAPDTEGLVDSLIYALSDEDQTNLIGTLHCLQALGPRAAPAVPKLVNLLDDFRWPPDAGTPEDVPDWNVPGGPDARGHIIRTLGAIGPAAAAALPLLEKIASMSPAEIGATECDTLAKEAIAKIKGTGQKEDKSVETPDEPKVSTGGVSPVFKPSAGGSKIPAGEVSPVFRPRSAPRGSEGSAYQESRVRRYAKA